MRLLLDTHALVWFITDHPNLSATAKTLIEDGNNQILVSIGSLWEIAIKMSLNKLTMGAAFEHLIPQQLIDNDIDLLPIHISHLQRLIEVPLHHRDPFDRLLVAQSLTERLSLISRDPTFDSYLIDRLWM